ncbi:sugar nucleotide-binding protein, partial [Massilia sp. CT11-108]|uniref:sugar nucleotide-binding protein n=1 Tax=Massilia sp. CT11-108 TaxID=3393900 RepID=UPI0039A5063E
MSEARSQIGQGTSRVLITGAQGQVGRELQHVFLRKGYEVQSMGQSELDVTDTDQCFQVFRRLNPDLVIHAAAYTNVDRAES